MLTCGRRRCRWSLGNANVARLITGCEPPAIYEGRMGSGRGPAPCPSPCPPPPRPSTAPAADPMPRAPSRHGPSRPPAPSPKNGRPSQLSGRRPMRHPCTVASASPGATHRASLSTKGVRTLPTLAPVQVTSAPRASRECSAGRVPDCLRRQTCPWGSTSRPWRRLQWRASRRRRPAPCGVVRPVTQWPPCRPAPWYPPEHGRVHARPKSGPGPGGRHRCQIAWFSCERRAPLRLHGVEPPPHGAALGSAQRRSGPTPSQASGAAGGGPGAGSCREGARRP